MKFEVIWSNFQGPHSLGEFDVETSLKLIKLLSQTPDFEGASVVAKHNSYEQELKDEFGTYKKGKVSVYDH